MAYSVTGTPGPNTIDQSANTGPGKIVGLGGDDFIKTGKGAVTVDGGADEDTIVLQAGNTGLVTGGTENDYIQGGNTGLDDAVRQRRCRHDRRYTRARR
jgi:Ca2+-binding RTX toxin-like protein